MKTNKFFAIAAMAVATLFASCAKDNGVETSEAKPAKISIQINSPAADANTRVEGAGNATISVTNYIAYAVNPSTKTVEGFVSGAAHTSGAATPVIAATTAATEVYVIANYDNLSADEGKTIAETLEAITSRDVLLALFADLKKDLNTSTQSETVVLLTGSGSVDWTTDPENGTATVNIKPIAARINVKLTDLRTNKDDAAAWKVTGIELYNVTAESKLFGTALVNNATGGTNQKYYAGGNMTAFDKRPEDPTCSVWTYLQNVQNVPTVDPLYSHFYAFENASADFPTIIAITTQKGGAGDKRYFFAQFTNGDLGRIKGEAKTVARGNDYNIGITLSSRLDATDNSTGGGSGGGQTDPTTPIVTSNMTVTVDVKPWNTIEADKEF